MQSAQNEVCPSCGVLLTGHVARCPACGFLLASAPGPVYQNSLPPKRPRPVGSARSSVPTAVMLLGLGVAVGIVVVGFWVVRQRDDQRAALPAPSAAMSALPAPAPSAVPVVLEPTTLFAKAKSAAVAWHTDATLVEIEIAPVTLGKVGQGGKLAFTFGKPAGKRLGPGAPVQGTGFVVTADANGVQGGERTLTKSSALAAEPNCIFEDLLGKLEKTGIPSGEKLQLRYAMNEKIARSVWRVSRVGESEVLRTVDGANCAIIVR